MRIHSPRDFSMGVLYVGVGLAALLLARTYSFGSANRMGPGFFPTIVASLAVGVGALSILRSFHHEGEEIGPVKWKPILLILGAILTFAVLVEAAGFIVAATVLLLMSALASRSFRLEAPATLGLIALVALSALVFVRGLGVPMPLIGSW